MTTESWRGQTVDKVEDLPIDESVSRRREARALLGSLLKPYRFAVLLLGLVVVVENGARLSVPLLVQRGIDHGIPPIVQGGPARELLLTDDVRERAAALLPRFPALSTPLADITCVEVVSVPWWYGRGIHLTARGWIYNVGGNRAVEITLKSGRRFMLGTDEPELLAHRGTYWQFWNDRLHASGWTIDGSDPNNFNQLDTLEDKS